MRRAELINGCGNILKALSDSEIESTLRTFISRGERSGVQSEDIVGSMQKFSVFHSRFSSVEINIIAILGLSNLAGSGFWSTVFTAERGPESHHLIITMVEAVERSTAFLPTFIELIGNEATRRSSAEKVESQEKTENSAILNVIVIEDEEHISTPQRLISVLNSVSQIYHVAAAIENLPDNDLTVISCDSGGDKEFNFNGAASNINRVKEILLSAWDRIMFHKEIEFEKRLNLVSKSLPILEEIKSKKKSLGAENAKILERTVMDGIKSFVASGAMLSEMEERATFDPRQLMAPKQKLLVHKDVDATDEAGTSGQRLKSD